MAILAIAAILLFISPAFYRLKAKGYAPAPFISGTLLLLILAGAIGYMLHPIGILVAGLLPLGLLGLAVLLPPREGAPGSGYLTLSFPCPECGKTVAFPRHAAGRASLCPECGELLRVPDEKGDAAGTPGPRGELSSPADPTAAFVTVGRFLSPTQAELARERLAAHGIPAMLPDSTISHVHPGVEWASGGFRLVVPSRYATQARDVMALPEEDLRLPEGFVPPAAPAQAPAGNRLAEALLLSIAVLFVLPPLIVVFWGWIVPNLFVEAVQEGALKASISYAQAFQFSGVVSLAFVAIAYFLECGRKRPPGEPPCPEPPEQSGPRSDRD